MGAYDPLSPSNDVIAKAQRVPITDSLTGVGRRLARSQNLLTDLLVVTEIGPIGREPHDNAACRLIDQRCNFDEPCSPGARLPLSERVMFATAVVMPATNSTAECLNRNFLSLVFG